MKWPRRNHAPAFKAKVALAALKGDRALAEFAEQSDFHPNQSVFTLHDRRFAGHKALRHRETSGEDGGTYASLPKRFRLPCNTIHCCRAGFTWPLHWQPPRREHHRE